MANQLIVCLMVVQCMICLAVFALDIAIVVQTSIAFETALANGDLDDYGYDGYGYGYFPFIPPDYDIGNYLNLATASIGIASLIGIIICWGFVVEFLNWVMFIAAFAYMISGNKAFQACPYSISSQLTPDGNSLLSPGDWLCIIPDVATGLDIIICILWILMFVISIWEANRKRPQSPATVPLQLQMRGPGNQPDFANSGYYSGYYNYPVGMPAASVPIRADVPDSRAQSPNYGGRATEVGWRPQSPNDREIVEAQGDPRSQSPYYGGKVEPSKQAEQRLQSPYYGERVEMHEDSYPERQSPVYGGRVQSVDGALGRAPSRPTRVPVPTTYIPQNSITAQTQNV